MQFILTEKKKTGIVVCGPHCPRIENVTLQILQTMTILVLFDGIKTYLEQKRHKFSQKRKSNEHSTQTTKDFMAKKSIRKIAIMDVINIFSLSSMNRT